MLTCEQEIDALICMALRSWGCLRSLGLTSGMAGSRSSVTSKDDIISGSLFILYSLASYLPACPFLFSLTLFPELTAFSEMGQGENQSHSNLMVDCPGEDSSAVTLPQPELTITNPLQHFPESGSSWFFCFTPHHLPPGDFSPWTSIGWHLLEQDMSACVAFWLAWMPAVIVLSLLSAYSSKGRRCPWGWGGWLWSWSAPPGGSRLAKPGCT